uniref:Aminoglycoside phosphotransferase family protein n=1 Tax=candidate division CPR3 bacterium TaxID=2268181 RepID=A0A7C5YXQ8_UNCC3
MTSYFEQIEKFVEVRKRIFLLKADIPLEVIWRNNLNKNAIEQKEIISLCSKYFSEPPLQVDQLSNGGTFHTIYTVKFSGRKDVVVRANSIEHSYVGPDFYLDKYIGSKLNSLGLPALNVFHIDISRSVYPFDYQIIEKANGTILNSINDQKEFEKSVVILGRFVAEYHKIKIGMFGPLNLLALIKSEEWKGLHDSWRDFLLLNLKQHVDLCVSANGLKPEEAIEINKKFEYPEYFNIGDGYLLHGDLGNHNIFVHNNQALIIDWEDCIAGDPVFDISCWGSFYKNDSERALELFLKGYKEKGKLPKDFFIRYWLYYLRIVLAKAVHRYKFRYSTLNEYKIKKALEKLNELGL